MMWQSSYKNKEVSTLPNGMVRQGEHYQVVAEVRKARPDGKGLISCVVGDSHVLLPEVEVAAGILVEGSHPYIMRNRQLDLRKAIELAAAAHGNQKDKGDGTPYVRHCFRVMEAVSSYGEVYMIVAVLHDVVEDTWVTFEYLRKLGATDKIIEAIRSVSKRKGEPYEDLLRRARANPIGLVVKLADNEDNSDEDRLASFSSEEARYFRDKYSKARRILMGLDD